MSSANALLVQQISSLRAMLEAQGISPDTLSDFDAFIKKLSRDMEVKNDATRNTATPGPTGKLAL